MERVLWKGHPMMNITDNDKHCGTCILSALLKERSEGCNAARVEDNNDGTVTVISDCSGQRFTYEKRIILTEGEDGETV
jgi:hypothetical protein